MPQPRLHANHAARQASYRHRLVQARREQLSAKGLPPFPSIATMPGNARWTQAIEQAASMLTDVVDEMEEYYTDRSEIWREDDRGDTHQQRTEALQEVIEALEQVWV
jgi:hypothetical protein